MNFVINVDEERVVGWVDVHAVGMNNLTISAARDMPLLHVESRYNQDTGESIVAVVYKMPPARP